jgi:galactose mutarotase-like enzyme
MGNKLWSDKINNISQIAGIETSVIDNGPAKGTRIANINTGSGLRYKILLDRASDIESASYNQYNLSWLSHKGANCVNPAANSGVEWLYSFAGGLLTTCGLTHIGGPEEDENGSRGIHGRISNIPCEVEAITQPSLDNPDSQMQVKTLTKQSKVFGPNLELRRTISSPLCKSIINVKDTVTNRGNTETPLMLLYHCNFGYHLVDEGSEILWDGDWESRGNDMDNAIFNKENDFHKCPPPLKEHSGSKEACGFIDTKADENGKCYAGIYNPNLEIAVKMSFVKKQLPWLTNWQHFGIGEYVTALEPGTNPPLGQKKAGEQDELIYLKPGRSREFELGFEIISGSKQIQKFKESF